MSLIGFGAGSSILFALGSLVLETASTFFSLFFFWQCTVCFIIVGMVLFFVLVYIGTV
jgi:hypothetical protein